VQDGNACRNREAQAGHSTLAVRGVAPGEDVSDEDFKVQAEALNGELESLSVQAENWSRSSPRM